MVTGVTVLNPRTGRCVCGHGPWSHSLIAFRQAEGQLLRTTGICAGGNCDCQTYETRPRIALPNRPRRPPRGFTWKRDV